MSTVLLTLLALIAFAANSVLCRLALGADLIDPVSFTIIRLTSGALVLLPLAWAAESGRGSPWGSGSWLSAVALLAYAGAFALAYQSLATGTGALILFAFVQATMIGAAVYRGERPGARQWLGVAMAMMGLAYLLAPGVAAPHPPGAALMALAGAAWGVYSLRGRRATDPVATTADNFGRAALLAVPMLAAAPWYGQASAAGAGLAAASGAVTSGLGYVAWYAAVPRLGPTRAAVVQLLVPVLAAVGGIALLDEPLVTRVVVSGLVTLGGIGLVVVRPRRPAGWSQVR